jgi:hypothetical protein
VLCVVENIFTNNIWIISVHNILLLEFVLSSHISKKNTACIFIIVHVVMDYFEDGGFLKILVPIHQSVCLLCSSGRKSSSALLYVIMSFNALFTFKSL